MPDFRLVGIGFDGLKLDSCGPSQDLQQWAARLNKTGSPVLLENCFNNASFPYVKSGIDSRIPGELLPPAQVSFEKLLEFHAQEHLNCLYEYLNLVAVVHCLTMISGCARRCLSDEPFPHRR